jgi:hypothetical protein
MLRDQVSVRHLDLVDAARMFAAADMSAADTIIASATPRPGTGGSGSPTGPSTTTSSHSTATARRDSLGGMSDRQVVVRRGRRLGWWVEGRSAGGRLFMKTWWPTQGLARTVARLFA